MSRRSRLAAFIFSVAASVAANAGDFIRVDEDATAARLQTAVTRYEKDGAAVELIGAIHIADKAYYEALTERFATYDRVLFEMIGGERLGAGPPPPPAGKARNVGGLHQLYDSIARFLELTGQLDSIDYRTANFVHADLTNAEFVELQNKRGESLLGFAFAASRRPDEGPEPPDPVRLLKALLTRNAAAVKLEIVHTLGGGDDQVAALAGESVVVTDRNARCMEVLRQELAAGHDQLGIFYGAAHFPDMEKRLLEMGFTRTGREWLTAWNIPKPAVKMKKAG